MPTGKLTAILNANQDTRMNSTTVSTAADFWEFNRTRTLKTLDEIAGVDDPQAVLGWRPGDGRAHIAWQLMHVAITEELFATVRLVGKPAGFEDLLDRYRGGSTPDDDIPTVDEIRNVLAETRSHLLETVSEFTDADLSRIPEGILTERGWDVATVLKVLGWHESHHQGQGHITLNLWKAQQA